MILKIEKEVDNKILRTASKKVDRVTKKTIKFLADMEDTMFATNGVGIAAPQVGVNDRMALAIIDGNKVFAIINPEIIESSKEMTTKDEGCLSLPGVWGKVPRHKYVTVRFMNDSGKILTMKFSNFNARVMQHEIDHLNGRLFVDKAVGDLTIEK